MICIGTSGSHDKPIILIQWRHVGMNVWKEVQKGGCKWTKWQRIASVTTLGIEARDTYRTQVL